MLIDKIKAAAVEDWRAAAWILERSYREEYGKSWADEHPQQRITVNINADEHARRMREIFGVKDAQVIEEQPQLEDGANGDTVSD